ncbi:peptide chain release factor N(5)-glutamine methyltransferase [Sediminibacterium roseum]|uniref:Release factor glutamine methyltransferase n=1 Tax=Sediminibacterium roseum TaxID=1978412 RepID=A0ABW9ZVP2_9BACT|nr:peptide chain release factor N(5)-glutamine methyltransferase [Sediminibacterium roseum]NCI51243.1 peptide chain release factor N(5)-glutamine methyltransferase [Sediminibacterium roseum]
MTIQQAQQHTVSQLRLLYSERESANIADWVLEHVTGQRRIDRLMNKQEKLPAAQQAQLTSLLQQLATHRPVQYVLGEAWFSGYRFFVNEHVLIPRPETEELVEWVAEEIGRSLHQNQNLLDIGTGSGCIPISIKKKNPAVSVTAVDISEEALQVAKKNAAALSAEVNFIQLDFLNEATWDALPVFDIITSNPPYIKQSEEKEMSQNVLAFEPAIALFVPDNDPLLFYRRIAAFAKKHLAEKGMVFLEINEALGEETRQLFEQNGFAAVVKKDLQGKDRMVMLRTPANR